MSSDPAVQPGQLSPDGFWRWDGAQWVPVAPGSAPLPPPRRSQGWVWWLVGGCAVLLVVGVVAAGFGVYGLVTRFQSGAFSCLPSDFPSYPGASVLSENTKVGSNFGPGDTKQCTMVLESSDSQDAVMSFYVQRLSTGDWSIASTEIQNGPIDFQRKSRPQTVGSLSLQPSGQHTEIDIQLNS